MADFFKKYMSWDSMKDDLASLYAEEFTVDQLKKLTTFFKTTAGQAFAEKQPVLVAKGAALGQQRVKEHMPELQQAIQAAMQKEQGQWAG